MKWHLSDQPQEVLRDRETSMSMIDSLVVYLRRVISVSKCWIVGMLGGIHRSALGFVAFGGPEAKSCPCFHCGCAENLSNISGIPKSESII